MANAEIYVTGLTSVTIEVMKYFKYFRGDIRVRFMHYDRETDTYVAQDI